MKNVIHFRLQHEEMLGDFALSQVTEMIVRIPEQISQCPPSREEKGAQRRDSHEYETGEKPLPSLGPDSEENSNADQGHCDWHQGSAAHSEKHVFVIFRDASPQGFTWPAKELEFDGCTIAPSSAYHDRGSHHSEEKEEKVPAEP